MALRPPVSRGLPLSKLSDQPFGLLQLAYAIYNMSLNLKKLPVCTNNRECDCSMLYPTVHSARRARGLVSVMPGVTSPARHIGGYALKINRIHILALFVVGVVAMCAAVWVNAGTTGAISGVVRSAEDGSPLAGANIVISGTKMTTVTDDNGYFIITNVPPGEYELTAEMVGYSSEVIDDVQVTMDATASVAFDMRLEAIAETEVVVSRPKSMIATDVPHTLNLLTSGQEEMTRSDPASLHTVPGVLSSLPGVVVSPDGLGQIHMRGGRADQVGYYIEGIPVTDPNTGYFGTNLFTTGVGKFQMYSGGFGAEYGNALSGVLNEVKKTGSQAAGLNIDTEYGNQTYRNMMVQFGDETPSGFNYYVASLLQSSELDGPVVKEQEYSDNVIKLVWPWKNDSLTVLGLQGSMLGKPNDTNTMRQRYAIGAVTWSHNYSPRSFIQVRPYYMFSTTVFNNVDSQSLADAWSTQHGLQVQYSSSLNEKHMLGVGGSLLRSNNNSYQYFGMPFSEADIDTFQTDFYVEDQFKINNKWMVQAGLRYDRIKYDRVGLDYITGEGYTGDPIADATESGVTPRLGVSFSPDESTAWKLSWGKYLKFMPASYVQTVYADPDMPVDEFGTTLYNSTPGLASTAPQRSTIFEISYEKQLTDTVMMRLSPFYSDYTNLVQTRVTAEGGMVFDNIGAGTSKGVELLFKKRMSNKWQGWLSYTYQKAKANSQTEWYPIFGAPDQDWYTSWDQRHTLSLVADYRDDKWRHNLRVDFGSGLADIWDPSDGEPQGRANPHAIVSYTVAHDLAATPFVGDYIYLSVYNLFNTHQTLQYDWKGGNRVRSAWVPSRFISVGIASAF